MNAIHGHLNHSPTLVSVPALSVWVRDRVGPIDCTACGGRRAYVCMSCKGQGGCECDMGYEHSCGTCSGTGFRKCRECTPKIEWEEIPRPVVRLCGVDVSAWDLMDQLSSIRSIIVRALADGTQLQLQTRRTKRIVSPIGRHEPRKNQPVYEYPVEQLVLPLARA